MLLQFMISPCESAAAAACPALPCVLQVAYTLQDALARPGLTVTASTEEFHIVILYLHTYTPLKALYGTA